MKDIFLRILTLIRFAVSDFKSKYAGSALGVIWAVAEPLVTVAVYRFVYTVAFGGAPIGGVPYYLWLAVGIAPWFFISEGLRSVCGAFRDYSYLVKKMRFNKKILPSVRGLSALFSHLLFMVIVLAAARLTGIDLSGLGYLTLIVVICYLYIVLLGKILAILCGYFKDVQNILGVFLNIAFWVTPIFWDISSLNGNMRRLAELNPAALIAEGYRNAVLHGSGLSGEKLAYLMSVCLILYLAGVLAEKKLLPNIADKL